MINKDAGLMLYFIICRREQKNLNRSPRKNTLLMLFTFIGYWGSLLVTKKDKKILF